MHPVLIRLGPLTLYTYGVLVAVGFVLGTWVAGAAAQARGWPRTLAFDVTGTGLLAGLVGGRGLYVLMNVEHYRRAPLEILALWEGGLVWYGGLAAGLAGAVWMIRRRRVPVLEGLDWVMPALALGHAVGRVGCFLNGCCYGTPTSWPVGVYMPGLAERVHPAQLYESAALLVLFGGLAVLQGRRPRRGLVLAAYLVGYGVIRFALEFVRGDQVPWVGGLTWAQWISVGLVVAGVALGVGGRGRGVDGERPPRGTGSERPMRVGSGPGRA